MAVNLMKRGERINLSKDYGVGEAEGIKELFFGLGWDTNQYDGGYDFDLDASAIILDENDKVVSEEDFIFYRNPVSKTGAVKHSGDNRTGEGAGDDEVIEINFDLLPDYAKKIVLMVTIYDAHRRGQNFGQVKNSYVRVVNKQTGKELRRYELEDDFSVETGIVVAEVYKKNGEWRFAAVGRGYEGGLKALLKNFGIDAIGEDEVQN